MQAEYQTLKYFLKTCCCVYPPSTLDELSAYLFYTEAPCRSPRISIYPNILCPCLLPFVKLWSLSWARARLPGVGSCTCTFVWNASLPPLLHKSIMILPAWTSSSSIHCHHVPERQKSVNHEAALARLAIDLKNLLSELLHLFITPLSPA